MTIDQFNENYVAFERKRLSNIKVHDIKRFVIYHTKTQKRTKIETMTEFGIPIIETEIEQLPKPIVKMDIPAFNKMIVAYLKMYTDPIKAHVTNTTGRYIPKVGFVVNKDKGRADITIQYKDFELCIETKQRYEKQLESQKSFETMANQQSFRKYVLCRDFDEFQNEMRKIFKNLPE